MPNSVATRLRHSYTQAAAAHLLQQACLRTLLDSLMAEGISPIVLKGMPLAESLYPDPALRQAGDIDLMLRPSETPRAERILESLGYIQAGRSWNFRTPTRTTITIWPPTCIRACQAWLSYTLTFSDHRAPGLWTAGPYGTGYVRRPRAARPICYLPRKISSCTFAFISTTTAVWPAPEDSYICAI